LLSSYKTLTGSALLEFVAFGFLKVGNPYIAVFGFLFFHLVASLLFSVFIYSFLSSVYKKARGSFPAVFLSVFLFPLVGYVAYLIFFLIVLRKQRREERLPVSRIQVEEVTMDNVKVKPRKFGEGIFQFFRKEAERIDERAIFLLKEMESPISIEIAKKALRSPKDEVRLAAFSIISKLEKSINEKISFLKSRLKDVQNEREKLAVYKKLALLYWELIYFGLVDEELEKFVVEETLYYAMKVLERRDDPDVYLVAGRIYLKKKNFDKAYYYLSKALESGDTVTKIRVIPYLAEIEFYRGNYEGVKELFKQIPLTLHPNVYFMKLLWEGKLKNGNFE